MVVKKILVRWKSHENEADENVKWKKVAVFYHCNLFLFISLLLIYNGIYSTNASIAS